MGWIPLHVHSQYSILHSTAQIPALVDQAVEYGCSALALTDQGNMYGAVEFYKTCTAKNIKPILGCELHIAPFSRLNKKRTPGFSAGYPAIFLIKNNVGYKNLCKLSSFAHVERDPSGFLFWFGAALPTLITLLFYCIAHSMWRIGLRQYTSASS